VSAFTTISGLAVLLLGAFLLWSCAYAVWGSTEVRWRDGAWIFARRVGRWSKTSRVRASQVHHVELQAPMLYAPGGARPDQQGSFLLLHLYGTDRVVEVAAGLCLPADVLDALRQLLATRDGL
jgi:hypothetical protein